MSGPPETKSQLGVILAGKKILFLFFCIFSRIMMCRFQKCKKIFFENFYYARPAPMVMGRA